MRKGKGNTREKSGAKEKYHLSGKVRERWMGLLAIQYGVFSVILRPLLMGCRHGTAWPPQGFFLSSMGC